MPKCKNCGRERLDHKARDLACPIGRKTRIGHIHYHTNQFFSEKEKTKKKKKSKKVKPKKDKLFGNVHWTDGTRVAVCSPYGDAEWDISSNVDEVTCGTCKRIIKSRFPG
jgi:hypothetical protein